MIIWIGGGFIGKQQILVRSLNKHILALFVRKPLTFRKSKDFISKKSRSVVAVVTFVNHRLRLSPGPEASGLTGSCTGSLVGQRIESQMQEHPRLSWLRASPLQVSEGETPCNQGPPAAGAPRRSVPSGPERLLPVKQKSGTTGIGSRRAMACLARPYHAKGKNLDMWWLDSSQSSLWRSELPQQRR